MAFNRKKVLDEERTSKKGKTCLREVFIPFKRSTGRYVHATLMSQEIRKVWQTEKL